MINWDQHHIDNFDVLSNKIKFIPRTKDKEWYFELNIKNMYFDDLAFMIEFLQGIGEMRFKVNTSISREAI